MAELSTGSHNFKLSVQASLINELDSGRQTTSDFSIDAIVDQIVNGVDGSQVDRAYEAIGITISEGVSLTVNLGTMSQLDIGTGYGLDALGQAVYFAEIVMFVITKTGGEGKLEINPGSQPSSPAQWMAVNEAADSTGGAIRTGGMRAYYDSSESALVPGNVTFKAVDGNVEFSIHVFGRHDTEASSSSSLSSSSSSSSSLSSSSLSSSSSSSYSSSSQSSYSSVSSSSSSP